MSILVETKSSKAQLLSEGARLLVIMERDQLDLYRYLRQDFAEYKHVEVILDRRHEYRRQQAEVHGLPEQTADRRRPMSLDTDLRHHAFVIVPQSPSALGLTP